MKKKLVIFICKSCWWYFWPVDSSSMWFSASLICFFLVLLLVICAHVFRLRTCSAPKSQRQDIACEILRFFGSTVYQGLNVGHTTRRSVTAAPAQCVQNGGGGKLQRKHDVRFFYARFFSRTLGQESIFWWGGLRGGGYPCWQEKNAFPQKNFLVFLSRKTRLFNLVFVVRFFWRRLYHHRRWEDQLQG